MTDPRPNGAPLDKIFGSRVLISRITVKDRRREDFGDIESLAESIRKHGLLHPVVVVGDEKDGYDLVAGERRLRACKLIGWTQIPIRLYAELTDDERNEIELEENLLRKDLTPHEQARTIVRLVEAAAKIIKTEPKKELLPTTGNNSLPAHRPLKHDSQVKVAERIGIPRQTISRALQEDSALKRYPELEIVPTQKDALTIAKNLDALPEDEREQARDCLRQLETDTTAKLADQLPALLGKPAKQLANEDGERRWRKLLHDVNVVARGFRDNGGFAAIRSKWSRPFKVDYLDSLEVAIEQFTEWKNILAEDLENEETTEPTTGRTAGSDTETTARPVHARNG